MSNEVQIDEAALAREAAAVDVPADDFAPLEAGEPGGEPAPRSIDDIATGYEPVTGMMIAGIADGALPNWRLTIDEKKQLAHASAVALAHWFPDGEIPPKYASLVMLAYVGYSIVEARRDPSTGELRPRKIVAETRRDEPAAPAGAAPSELRTGGFSTAA